MLKLDPIKGMNEEERLKYMIMLLRGQLSSEKDELANLSNASAIVDVCVDELNWSGFYLMRGGQLVLGPFQGLPACNRIDIGKGVCGTAAESRETQLIQDVHLFPGHIACDSASNSELVVPIIKHGTVYGVLDMDSPRKGRFTEIHAGYFEKFVQLLNEYIDWTKITF